jgi:hypothetical protein
MKIDPTFTMVCLASAEVLAAGYLRHKADRLFYQRLASCRDYYLISSLFSIASIITLGCAVYHAATNP